MATIEQYNGWRSRLIDIIDSVIKSADTLAPEKVRMYEMLRDQMRDDTLKIQVVGTVKNGKSSFTNALLGEEMLPVDDIPCTAVVSEVHYGPEKKAIITFCSPTPTGLLDEIPAETKAHIVRHNMGKGPDGKPTPIPPITVPYDKMKDYVAIPEPTPDILFDPEKMAAYKKKIDQESPFDVAQIFYPTPLLQNGVELVDSPGLNEAEKRTAVTLNYLKKADAAIYLLDACKPATKEEKEVIERVLLPLGFRDLIMVMNRSDMSRDREKIKLYCQGQVQGYTSVKEFFAVSAKEALDGEARGDRALVEQSGMPQFKEFLINYVTKRKGQLKINKTAGQVANSVKLDILESIIPSRLSALAADSHELQRRLNEARPKLSRLEADRQKLLSGLEQNIPIALIPIQKAIESFFEKIQPQLCDWIWKYNHKHNYGMYPNKKDLEIIANECLEHAKQQLDVAYQKWNTETFQPVLMEQAQMVFGGVKDDIEDLAREISSIEGILKGLDSKDIQQSTTVERIVGVAAMILAPIGYTGGEIFSSGFNLERFLKSFAVEVGVGLGVGLLAFWVWPPAGVLAVVFGIITGMLTGNERKIDDLKSKLIANLLDGIKNDTPERVSNIITDIRTTFDDIKNSVMAGVDSEVEAVRNQLAEIERLTTSEQNSIDKKRAELQIVSGNLAGAVGQLEGLIREVDANS